MTSLAEAGAKLCVETLKALEDKTATWEVQGRKSDSICERCWIRSLEISTGADLQSQSNA